jgi:hypothetical protein
VRQPLAGHRGERHALAPTAHDQIIGADLLRPQLDFDRRSDTAPSIGIRGDEHLRSSAARQIELYRVGVAMTAIRRAKRQLGRSGNEGIT